MEEKPIWWDYAVWYPSFDEEEYDGVHDGGIRGIKEDAPKEIKDAYRKYLKQEYENTRKGLIT